MAFVWRLEGHMNVLCTFNLGRVFTGSLSGKKYADHRSVFRTLSNICWKAPSWIFDRVMNITLDQLKFCILWRFEYRSSPLELFFKKSVLENFSKFTGKHQCQSLFFNKVAGFSKKPPQFFKLDYFIKINQK